VKKPTAKAKANPGKALSDNTEKKQSSAPSFPVGSARKPKSAQPHPGGRPSKYDSAYCEQVIAFLAKGHSVTAFAGSIGVARSTVFKWAEQIPEFSDALKVGQARATEFWEKILADVATTGKGNATAAIFGLKNRAHEDWADKQYNEHSGPGGGPIKHDLSRLTDEQLEDMVRILTAENGYVRAAATE
jgi:hypothetical protein